MLALQQQEQPRWLLLWPGRPLLPLLLLFGQIALFLSPCWGPAAALQVLHLRLQPILADLSACDPCLQLPAWLHVLSWRGTPWAC